MQPLDLLNDNSGVPIFFCSVLLFFGVILPPIIESQTSTPEKFRYPALIYGLQGNSTPIMINNDLLKVHRDNINSIWIEQVLGPGSRSYPFTVFGGSCEPTGTYTKTFSTDEDIELRNTSAPVFDSQWIQDDTNLSFSTKIWITSQECSRSCTSVYLLTSDSIMCLRSRSTVEKCGYYREFTSDDTDYNISKGILLEGGTITPGYYSMIIQSKHPSEIIIAQWSYNITSSYYVIPESSRKNPLCSITDQICKIMRHDLNKYDGKCLFILSYSDFTSQNSMLRYEISLRYYWLNSSNIPKLIIYIIGILIVIGLSVFIDIFFYRCLKQHSEYQEIPDTHSH